MTSGSFDASRPDGGDLRGALQRLPDRLRLLATRDLRGLALPEAATVTGVVVSAAGDAALDADLAVASVGVEATVPVAVVRGGLLPAWVGPTSLVVVVALGRVDRRNRDVLAAGVAAGATVVVLTADTAFAGDAVAAGARVVALEAADVQPRLLPGIVLVPLVGVLEAAGLFAGAGAVMATALDQAALTTAACAVQPEGRDRSDAAGLARRIGRTLPLIYAAEGVGGAAAQWWKSAVNQSAKLVAFANGVPAMAHSELAMFGQAGDLTRQVFTMVLLRLPTEVEGSLAADQLDRFDELFAEVVAQVLVVPCQARGLAAYLDLAIRGQWVGLELAHLAGVDPSAMSILDEFWAATGQ